MCVLQAELQLPELLLSVTDGTDAGHLLQALHVAGQRQDVEIVVQEHTGVVGGQAQDKPLVKPVDHVLVSLCSEPSNIHDERNDSD